MTTQKLFSLVCTYTVIAECAIELDVDGMSSGMSSDVRGYVETLICSEYQVTDSVLLSDIQLIAFKKFNRRFSAFVLSSSRNALGRLVQSYFCGKLREFLEQTVNGIVGGVRIKRIHWTVKDFARCNEYFLVRERPQGSNASTPTSSLPHTPPAFDFSNIGLGIRNSIVIVIIN